MPEPILCTDEALLTELRRVAALVDPPPTGLPEALFACSRTHGQAADAGDNRPGVP